MKAFSTDLDALRSVAAALLDPSGVLLEGNSGFVRLVVDSRLVDRDADHMGVRVSAFFIHPSFSALLGCSPGEADLLHDGLITVGNREGNVQTLRARVWRHPEGVRVLAEYDIDELERMKRSVLDLSGDSAVLHAETSRVNFRLRQREAQVVAASLTDPLTGAGNRRRLQEALTQEVVQAHQAGTPLSVFMADIDFFKRVNDRYGHRAGDDVLVRFAALMRDHLRAIDVLTRHGGEEFVVVMPNTGLAEGILAAERIRAVFAREPIPPMTEPASASFGVAELQRDEDGAALLERADRGLYMAKQGGRNRVEVYSAGS